MVVVNYPLQLLLLLPCGINIMYVYYYTLGWSRYTCRVAIAKIVNQSSHLIVGPRYVGRMLWYPSASISDGLSQHIMD